MRQMTLPTEDIIPRSPTEASELLRSLPNPPVTPGLPFGVEETLTQMAIQRLLDEKQPPEEEQPLPALRRATVR